MDGGEAKRCEHCEQMAGRVAQLETELARVCDPLARANKKSATSSKPTSGDITNPPAKRKKAGRPKKRKIGGRPGDPRHERAAFSEDEVDHILEYRYDGCPCCGGKLQDLSEEPKKH